MQTNDFRKKFNKLSLKTKEFLLSPELTSVIININDKHNLKQEQRLVLAKLLWKIITKEKLLSELGNLIKNQLKLEQEKINVLILDIYKEIFIHIKKDFPDVEALTKKLKSSSAPLDESNIVNLKEKEEKETDEPNIVNLKK